jgi:hypothetical protein
LYRWQIVGIALAIYTCHAVPLECSRLQDNKLLLYQAKTGTPIFVPLPPHVAELLRSVPPGLDPNPNYFF